MGSDALQPVPGSWHEQAMSAETDAELLDAARTGDRRALDELLGRHQGRIYRFGLKMCRDPEDAKDVLQDTLLAMARNIRDFRGASSLSTWLYSIARNFCIKKRRRSKFAPEEERSIDTAQSIADRAKSPDDQLSEKQIERAVDAAISALETSYREVLLLRDVEGLTAPEVGEVLGLSVDAVKSRLHRARVKVRADLAPLLALPADENLDKSTCPDVVTLFSRHLEDEISAETCAEMERHLQSCERCRVTCDSLKRTLFLCKTTPSAQVPASLQESVRIALQDFLAEG